jgi:hypothetical protein
MVDALRFSLGYRGIKVEGKTEDQMRAWRDEREK